MFQGKSTDGVDHRFVLGLEQVVEGKIIKDALHENDCPVLSYVPLRLIDTIKPALGGKRNFSVLLFEPANASVIRASADKSGGRGICNQTSS